MQIEDRNKNKKRVVVITVVAVLLVATAASLYFFTSLFRTNADRIESTTTGKVDYSAPTDDQKAAGDATKKENLEDDQDTSSTSNNPTIPVAITTATAEDGVAYVRAEISGIYNTGSCTLTLTKGTKSVIKQSGIQALPQSSTCKGFNITLSELESGVWGLVLQVSTGDKTGKASGELTI